MAPPGTSGGGNAVVTIIVVVLIGFGLIAFIGILAAIAIPNFLTAKQRALQTRTIADMRKLGSVIEAYGADNDGYPNVASFDELRPLLTPKFAESLPSTDGWRHPYRYSCIETREGRCVKYLVASAGKDGVFEENVDYTSPHATTAFNSDLVYSNGEFVAYPEGANH